MYTCLTVHNQGKIEQTLSEGIRKRTLNVVNFDEDDAEVVRVMRRKLKRRGGAAQ